MSGTEMLHSKQGSAGTSALAYYKLTVFDSCSYASELPVVCITYW